MQSDGRCVAAMLVLAGKRPTLRSSDSQTHTNTSPLAPPGSGRQGGRDLRVCVRQCKAGEDDSDVTLVK